MRWLHTITLILEKSSYNPHYSSMHFHFFPLLYKKSNVLSLFFTHTRIYHKLNWNYLLTIFDEYTFNFNYSNRNTFFKNKINRFIIIRKICIKKVSPITNRIHDFFFVLIWTNIQIDLLLICWNINIDSIEKYCKVQDGTAMLLRQGLYNKIAAF